MFSKHCELTMELQYRQRIAFLFCVGDILKVVGGGSIDSFVVFMIAHFLANKGT